MYRFSYWDDGPLGNVTSTAGPLHQQHWYVNHVTTASGGQAGVRWYEFRANIQEGGRHGSQAVSVWNLRSRLKQSLDGVHRSGQDG